jgi:hypothetical protein
VGPVGIDNRSDDKAIYGPGFTYSYFLQEVSAGGWSMGITPIMGKGQGGTKGGHFISFAY